MNQTAPADNFSLRWLPGTIGTIVALVGAMVLIGGWVLDMAWLRSIRPTFPSMKANAALALMFIGIALLSAARTTHFYRRATLLFSLIPACIASLTLAEFFLGIDLRIDQLLLADSLTPQTLHPGRMAGITAVCLLISSLSIMASLSGKLTLLSQLMACLVQLLCLIYVVGYQFGVHAAFGITSQVGMPVHTSACLLVVGGATLLLRPYQGIMVPFTTEGPGSLFARKYLPAAILIPPILGWFRWQGEMAEQFDSALGLTLHICFNIIVFTVLTWMVARTLAKSQEDRFKVEKAVEESDLRYRELIDSLPQMIWTCQSDGMCDFLSRRWLEYTGIPEKDQLGYGWIQCIHPEDRSPVQAAWEISKRQITLCNIEYRIRSSTGQYHWFNALGVPLIDSTGKVTKWFGGSTNIDRLKSSETALRESESRFRQLADAMPQIVWTAGADGRHLYFNHRWYVHTGYLPGGLDSSNWLSAIEESDREKWKQNWEQSICAGATLELELRLQRTLDSTFRWHLVRAIPIRDSDGMISKWFGTCTDINDLKLAEAANATMNEQLELRVRERTAELAHSNQILARTQAQLQGILDSATGVAIIATDANGTIRLFNSGAEKLLQYNANEVVGLHTPDLFHYGQSKPDGLVAANPYAEPVSPLELKQFFTLTSMQGGMDERDFIYIRKDGSTLDVRLVVTSTRIIGEDAEGLLFIASDLSARKSLERELRLNNEKIVFQTHKAEAANLAKTEFLATMSHEIRTPMNSILGMADLLWDTKLDEDQRKYVEVFRRAGSNLLNLINDILDLSRIEAGQLEIEHIEFDLEEMLDGVVELMGPRAREKKVNFIYQLSPGLPVRVMGDPTRIRQILINLLGNAIKFTHEGQVALLVQSAAKEGESWLEFQVSDTGIGIPPNKIALIFEDFTQVDSSTTRKYGGTGLGLAISRRTAQKLGGDVSAKSTFGAGSTFFLTLPLEPAAESPGQSSIDKIGFESQRILVVDGEVENRLLLKNTLSDWELRVDEADSVAAALRAIQENFYSLVIVDSHLPPSDGFSLASEMKAIGTGIPLIMLTSGNSPGDLSKLHEAHLAGYAVKPIRLSQLLKLVSKVLHRPDSGEFHQEMPFEAKPERSALNIMIAEDSIDNQLLLTVYLKDCRHILTFVEDGLAAVAKVESGCRFDMVFMDIQMPEMNGLRATQSIHAWEAERGWPSTPVVALTANARPEDVERSLQAGCVGHLSKPVSKLDLLKAIADYGYGPRDIQIQIAIPEGFEDLTPNYLATRQSDIARMREHIESAEHESLRVMAHKIKGSGSPYGLAYLSTLAQELESSARGGDEAAMRAQVDQMEDYLSRVVLRK